MPRYHYQAPTPKWREPEGMLRANNEREAARAERRGLAVIEAAARLARANGAAAWRHGDVILALQELATMLTSGVSIVGCVGSQALGAHHPRIVEAFAGMSRDLQRGEVFATLAAGCCPRVRGAAGTRRRVDRRTRRLLRDAGTQMEYEQQLKTRCATRSSTRGAGGGGRAAVAMACSSRGAEVRPVAATGEGPAAAGVGGAGIRDPDARTLGCSCWRSSGGWWPGLGAAQA